MHKSIRTCTQSWNQNETMQSALRDLQSNKTHLPLLNQGIHFVRVESETEKWEKLMDWAWQTLPLLSQGELMFQQGVENNMDSPEPFPFCCFSSSASSLHAEKEKVLVIGWCIQQNKGTNGLHENTFKFCLVLLVVQKSIQHLEADYCQLPHDTVPLTSATPGLF